MKSEDLPYRYTLNRKQHELLFTLAKGWPDSVYHVLPYYITESKLQTDIPRLQDTWFLDIGQMETSVVFGANRTKRISCNRGQAYVNPEFEITGSTAPADIEKFD